MTTTADDSQNAGGVTALRQLKSTDPPLYLSASPDLSRAARLASKYLYSSLKPYTPKSPFAQLLTDGFDAEQIWQQIDLQSEPLLSTLRRQIRHFEKKPEEITKNLNLVSGGNEKRSSLERVKEEMELYGESEDINMENFDDDDDEEEDEEEVEEEEDEEESDDSEKMGDGEKGGLGGVEDRFFKIDELEEYMEDDEAREYGLKKKKNKRVRSKSEEDDDDEEEGDEEEEEEDDELGLMGLDDDEDDENGGTESARYEDFFSSKKGTGQKKKVKSSNLSDGLGTDDEMSDDDDDDNQKTKSLSTHEKDLQKLRSTIEEMEKSNLEEKAWTMQGEVTAAKRQKNSALEVDLDFEHNVRPAPVITEEVTASLEELIQKRIIEGQFDDVQKPASLPSRAPREIKELDDNKSKKGLAEIYEEEYVQKTGLVSTALSFSDEQKKEASMLFKKLCLKLDALSHFHFTPKPVIEDMSIQANVPALAMEEIAPVAVSDAAMLAPEEVFTGKGDVKEETELTQEERKRRRAKKKRKFKAESAKRMVKVAPQNTLANGVESNEKS